MYWMTSFLAQRSRLDRSFERLYRRHVSQVYHYVLAVLQDPTDAEDVTQTTFMNAYRAFERGERPRSPHNWLIAIAHNVCRQRFRQASRRPTEVALDESHGGVLDDDGEAPSPADIRRALGYLAFNQRAALVMRELEGRSYADIAGILDVSVPAVETLIFRARRALREQLEEGLTCGEAERAISRQLDGALPRGDKGALRAHLRECTECATFARRQRAHRAVLKGLGALPLPLSLQSLFGGGAAGTATVATASSAGLGVKVAAMAAAGLVTTGVTYEAARQTTPFSGDAKAVPREAVVPATPRQARAVIRRVASRPPQALVHDRPIAPAARRSARAAEGQDRGPGRKRISSVPGQPGKRRPVESVAARDLPDELARGKVDRSSPVPTLAKGRRRSLIHPLPKTVRPVRHRKSGSTAAQNPKPKLQPRPKLARATRRATRPPVPGQGAAPVAKQARKEKSVENPGGRAVKPPDEAKIAKPEKPENPKGPPGASPPGHGPPGGLRGP